MIKNLVLLITLVLSTQLFSKAPSNQYHNYSEMTEYLKQLALDHSDFVKVESQGKTLGNKDVWALTTSKGDAANKPAMLIVGGVEGADVVSSEMCLLFVDFLVTNYDKVDSLKQLVDNTTFYIFPRVNPDATEAFWGKVKYERFFNSRPMDLDYDGEFDEDGYDDLNNDGLITSMRILDPAGEWIIDDKDPELMRKADRSKGEQGIYRILVEGTDNDKDGLLNEDESGGVNFNQNFAFNYQFFVPGAGVHQISEIETRAVADFCFAHPNVAVVFSFSRNGNMANPWKPKSTPQKKQNGRLITNVLTNDAKILDALSEKYKSITGFETKEKSTKMNGTFNEWAYYHYGRWSVSAPAWIVPTIEDKKDTSKVADQKEKKKKDGPIFEQRKLLKWLKKSNLENSFVQWQPVDHPDFPDQIVEVGGFKPWSAINPPLDSLNVLANKHNQFLLWLAGQLPEISISDPKVKKLSQGLYRTSIQIINNGFLPTNSDMGKKVQWARKVKVDLELSDGLKIASGRKMQLVESVSGSGGQKKVSWIISGKKGTVKINAGSPMAGFATKTIELK
jgi:murein tripeptide amidase MpaA